MINCGEGQELACDNDRSVEKKQKRVLVEQTNFQVYLTAAKKNCFDTYYN